MIGSARARHTLLPSAIGRFAITAKGFFCARLFLEGAKRGHTSSTRSARPRGKSSVLLMILPFSAKLQESNQAYCRRDVTRTCFVEGGGRWREVRRAGACRSAFATEIEGLMAGCGRRPLDALVLLLKSLSRGFD
jgi:hypothetical protein